MERFSRPRWNQDDYPRSVRQLCQVAIDEQQVRFEMLLEAPVELQEGPVPYYLAKFDGELAGARQVFFAIVLTSGSALEPVESLQGN